MVKYQTTFVYFQKEDTLDKKVVLTAAIVVAFLLSSSILVMFYNQDNDDKEINLIARVNTEGSGIYIDDKYSASDFIDVDSDGTPLIGEDGTITYHPDFWEGKIFGTPGPTTIQHVQLKSIVESMGLRFMLYTTGANTSPGCGIVYYNDSITNAAAFENSPQLDGGIIWQPQYQAMLESTVRPCVSLMTSADYDPGHTCCVIGASHEFITSNSDITVRFLAGYIKSVDWVNNAIADKSSDEYAELVQLAMDRTGISNRAVIEASLDSVNYVYGNDASLGDTADKPLASLEDAVADLVDNLGLANSVERQGFSDTYEFAQRYVNGGYLAKALDYEKSESGYSMSTVRVGVIAGDIHQIAIHLGIEKGFYEEYGINVEVSSASNGGGVATSLQNGEVVFGFVGAPPITTAVINGSLIPS